MHQPTIQHNAALTVFFQRLLFRTPCQQDAALAVCRAADFLSRASLRSYETPHFIALTEFPMHADDS